MITFLKTLAKYWWVIKIVLDAIGAFAKGSKSKEEVKQEINECIGDACEVIEEKKSQPRRRGGLFGRWRRK